MPKRAILYARVSTPRQAELYSLSYQLEQERQYAHDLGLSIVAEFADDMSGRKLERDGLTEARELLAQIHEEGRPFAVVAEEHAPPAAPPQVVYRRQLPSAMAAAVASAAAGSVQAGSEQAGGGQAGGLGGWWWVVGLAVVIAAVGAGWLLRRGRHSAQGE